MKTTLAATAVALLITQLVMAAPTLEILHSADPQSVLLADDHGAVAIAVDPQDYPVVNLTAGLFADDVDRVTGHRPTVAGQAVAPQAVIVGTLGHSALIDRLVQDGKLKDVDQIKDRWEATLWQIVDQPFPGVQRALVIAGSDRRGAAYGLMLLSEKIGVSPWYWWADVPTRHADVLAVKVGASQTDAPAVKYRGIFINDEDWGLNPWASKTFDPKFGNIGPKTYEKVFELLLRLRLNYVWPAMHACTAEFASQPENAQLADRFGIVVGSSHCEPMLCNNVHWNEKTQGKWDYTLNADAIRAYWEESAKTRGSEEAVWTLGIRGIHDAAMEGPKAIPTRLKIVSQVIHDQRALLDQHVSREWGPVAQCFVPYKEVLPIYDAGLPVPDDVTLVWADDNFGYIRRLSGPGERKRSGGSGVYWHLSYYGGPHSYTWINTTPPAFIWEELHKAWENDARTLWVINVGDIKPAEIGIDYYSRLAWDADRMGPRSQPAFLADFAAMNFGPMFSARIACLLHEFYRLGTIRKPELMERAWTLSLSPGDAAKLEHDYKALLSGETVLTAEVPDVARDAFTEMIGFPARVLGTTGLIFLADRKVQLGIDTANNEHEIERLRADLEAQVEHYNSKVAGGKWNGIMPGLVTGKDLMKWSSQVRWPWGEKPAAPGKVIARSKNADRPPEGQVWRDAAAANRGYEPRGARWTQVIGLGSSGRALALLPATVPKPWSRDDVTTWDPRLEYDFTSKGGDGMAFVDFLPTFRIYPGMKLRVAIGVDNQPPAEIEVPGSSGSEDERGPLRQAAVQDNFVRVRVPMPGLSAGKHTLKIQAIDPGVVIDRVSLP